MSGNAVTRGRCAVEAALRGLDDEQLPVSLLSPRGTWSLADDALRMLGRLAGLPWCEHVLELGSGTSTRLLARIADRRASRLAVTTIEHDPWYRAEVEHLLDDDGTVQHVRWIDAPLVLRECVLTERMHVVYDVAPGALAPADMVLIDGPPSLLGGRAGSLYQVLGSAQAGTIVMLDDANRAEEAEAVSSWERTLGDAVIVQRYPDFMKGLVVIIVVQPLGPLLRAQPVPVRHDRRGTGESMP